MFLGINFRLLKICDVILISIQDLLFNALNRYKFRLKSGVTFTVEGFHRPLIYNKIISMSIKMVMK